MLPALMFHFINTLVRPEQKSSETTTSTS
jgi:hypothetical protein